MCIKQRKPKPRKTGYQLSRYVRKGETAEVGAQAVVGVSRPVFTRRSGSGRGMRECEQELPLCAVREHLPSARAKTSLKR